MSTKENKLDAEHKGRIGELAKTFAEGKNVGVSDILSSPPIVREFESSKLLLPAYNVRRILLAYPFSKHILVPICPKCVPPAGIGALKILLHNNAITPVLIREYGQYPEPILKLILSSPHISFHEFMFLRYVMILANSEGGHLCPHCVAKRRKEFSELAKSVTQRDTQDLLDAFIGNLQPFIKPDYELLDVYGSALRAGRLDELDDLQNLSSAIWDARTCQAINARSLLPSRAVPRLLEQTKASIPRLSTRDLSSIESALAQNIHLDLPHEVDITDYIKCVAPYRDTLAAIADSIVSEASAHDDQLTRINSITHELNDRVAQLSRNKTYLAYRAAWGFARCNKALLGSLLLASAFGLAGNYLGCGASIAAAAGAQILKKCGKLQMPEEMVPFVDAVKHTLRPHVQKMVAKYLNIDVRTIQLYEINKILDQSRQRRNAPTKPRTVREARGGLRAGNG